MTDWDAPAPGSIHYGPEACPSCGVTNGAYHRVECDRLPGRRVSRWSERCTCGHIRHEHIDGTGECHVVTSRNSDGQPGSYCGCDAFAASARGVLYWPADAVCNCDAAPYGSQGHLSTCRQFVGGNCRNGAHTLCARLECHCYCHVNQTRCVACGLSDGHADHCRQRSLPHEQRGYVRAAAVAAAETTRAYDMGSITARLTGDQIRQMALIAQTTGQSMADLVRAVADLGRTMGTEASQVRQMACLHRGEERPRECRCALTCPCRKRMCHTVVGVEGVQSACRCGHGLEYHRPDMDGSGECIWRNPTCDCFSYHAASDPALRPKPVEARCACGHKPASHKGKGACVAIQNPTEGTYCPCEAYQQKDAKPDEPRPARGIRVRDE